MLTAAVAVGLLLAVVAALWVRRTFLEPARLFRTAIRRLANGEADGAFLVPRPFWLRGAADDLCHLAERVGAADRRRRDETVDLQAILSSLSEGVLVIDGQQRIRLANASLYRLFNLPEGAEGRTLMEVFRDQGLRDAALAAFGEPGPQSRQLSLDVAQDGKYATRHFTVTAVRMEGAAGAIAIFHDITQLNALSAARRDFVANVSHELRTPLSIINGYLETLLDGALEDGPTARRFVETMARNGERLNLLIEDLLSLSQIESRRRSGLNFEETSLRSCLERAVERLEPLIAEKRAAVALDFPSAAPMIEADSDRLDQVFLNLLENALKYSDSSDPAITVRARFDPDDAHIRVEDNGPGIPLLDQPHIFERFYRVHKDRARTVGGTGLGLSIVKHVVQAHGGEVTVEGAPGSGSAFCLRLPIRQRD